MCASTSTQRSVGGAGRDHLRRAILEHPPDEIARVGLIVDHQDLESGELGGDELRGARARRLRMQPLARVGTAMNGGQRQMHGDGRAQAFARALDPDDAAVQLDEALHDRQPEAEPAVLARRRRIALPESFEQMRNEFRLDADAGVGDADLDMRVHALEHDLDLAVLRRELDGVRQQIPDDLLKTARIAGDRPGRRIEEFLEPDALGVGGGPARSRSPPR